VAQFLLEDVETYNIAVSLMSAAFYNEMYDSDAGLRPHYRAFAEWLAGMPAERLERKRAEADTAFHRVGITFAVYGEEAGTERLIPFDIIPRIIPRPSGRSSRPACGNGCRR
jgi:uncharacterized circularly permuted ATP-grasp superfamily protein